MVSQSVKMNGFLLVKSEAKRANKIERHMLDNLGEWYNTSDFNRLLGKKSFQNKNRMFGVWHYQTKLTLLKLMVYYQKDHPNGYTMEHKRFGNTDYFRIVKVGTDE